MPRKEHCMKNPQMEGLSLSLKLFEELTKAWSEFATIGKRLMRASMNSRGALGL